jgi:diguanylate cyclase (GGDEF)-like protein
LLVLLDTSRPTFWSAVVKNFDVQAKQHKPDLFYFFFYNSLAIYLFVLVLALFSYRNLYNFKILLTGFLFLMTGVFSSLYFIGIPVSFSKILPIPHKEGLHFLLYLFYCLDLLVVSLVPSYLPRMATRVFLGLFVLLKTFIIFVGSWFLLHAVDIQLPWVLQPHFKTILGLNTVVAIISLWISDRRADFYGGVIAGLMVIFTVSYFKGRHIEVLLIQSVPVILAILVLANWIISLSHRASYDPLMNIYSRRYCDAIIEGRSHSLGRQYCIALLDIDHFKEVNDRYGHAAGDTVLYHVGLKIRDMALPRGITCRYGGEEIVVFFPDTTLEYAEKAVRDIVVSISRFKISVAKKKRNKTIQITISGGVAAGQKGKGEVKQVLITADQALYRSKQAGRNRVTVS